MVSLQAAVLALALAAPETVLVDFYADWCGPCRQMDGTVESLAQRGYPVRKVNIDQQRELARQFKVTQIPCFVLLVGGREANRAVGPQSLADFEQMFQAAGVGPQASKPAVARGQSPDPTERMPFPSTQSGEPFAIAGAAGNSTTIDPFERPVAASDESAPTVYASTPQSPDKVQADAVARRLLAASVRLKIDDGGSHSVGSGTIIDAREGESAGLDLRTCFAIRKAKDRS